MNCLTNPFSQKNAIELFTLVLTNINRIFQADPILAMYNMPRTILTDQETPIIRNSDLASTIDNLNNDTASLKIKNSIGSITQRMSKICNVRNYSCLEMTRLFSVERWQGFIIGSFFWGGMVAEN